MAQQQHKHAKLKKRKTRRVLLMESNSETYQSKQAPPPRNPFGKLSRDEGFCSTIGMLFFISI
jgi:hypothetical protein